MDFRRVLTTLVEGFDREGIRYAAMGGFAVSLLGVQRATVDLDFLVHRDDLDRADRFLNGLGYRRLHADENVSHYRSDEAAWGGLDFVHAFRPLAVGMLGRAKAVDLKGLDLAVRVLEPEDVIGLKLQAIANNPARESFDLSDIHALMREHATRMEWGRIKQYCEVLEMNSMYEEFERKFRC